MAHSHASSAKKINPIWFSLFHINNRRARSGLRVPPGTLWRRWASAIAYYGTETKLARATETERMYVRFKGNMSSRLFTAVEELDLAGVGLITSSLSYVKSRPLPQIKKMEFDGSKELRRIWARICSAMAHG